MSKRAELARMSSWGLTPEMRDTEPWNIPSGWFEAGKVITDPVHGDIFINRLEQAIIDTEPFQRLRRVRQLGTTHLVYPGATHTRFSHSLGALQVVQNLFDVAYSQRSGRRPATKDLFSEWDDQRDEELARLAPPTGSDPDALKAYLADRDEVERQYLRCVAEAMSLARLGALMHDFCHVPFGHSIEDELQILEPHDENEDRLSDLWDELCKGLGAQFEILERSGKSSQDELLGQIQPFVDGRLRDQLEPLILSSKKVNGKKVPAEERLENYQFVADMVGNTICADLLDYLVRDHRFTGLPLSLGWRYMSEFYVTPKSRKVYGGRMAVRIHRGGRERPDVVTELLKHLRYRYELQERVLSHHTKIAADAMVGKMLDLWREAMRLDRLPSNAPSTRKLSDDQDEELTSELESTLQHAGDDGLLELIRSNEQQASRKERVSERGRAAAAMASDLLSRNLYRHAADATGAYARETLHARFRKVEVRRELETRAADWAELDMELRGLRGVLIWVPPPDMRLKPARMLVDHGKGISPLENYSFKGREISDLHVQLWTIRVFVHRSVSPAKEQQVLAHLAKHMEVCWDRYVGRLGPIPTEWPERLAAMDAVGVLEVDETVEQLLKTDLRGYTGGAETHDQLKERFEQTLPRRGKRPRR